MTSITYLVSTTMGDSLRDPTSRVYVQVSPKSFLEKTVSDLNPGDLVLYSKPYATTDLEDVDPYLEKSPRYAKAREVVHDVNSRGECIPRLRGMLIRGLATKGVVSDDNLEKRILHETKDDFTKEEYERMEKYVRGLLTTEDGEYMISGAGVRNWLEGSVIAPRDWRALEVLSTELNSEFSEFEYGAEGPDSVYFNYRLYVVIRQGVMRFLKQARGEPAKQEWVDAENRISLSPEYAIVFNHFMKDYNLDNALARVNEVRRLNRPRQVDFIRKNDRLLGDGVITGILNFKLPRKTYKEVFYDSELLTNYLAAAIENFDSEQLRLERRERYLCGFPGVHYMLHHFDEISNPFTERFVSIFPTIHERIGVPFLPFMQEAKDALLLGDMDYRFGFDRGTMMTLLESVFRTNNALPLAVHNYLIRFVELAEKVGRRSPDLSRSPRKERRRIERERARISDRYNLKLDMKGNRQGGIFFSGLRTVMDLAGMESKSPREFVSYCSSNLSRRENSDMVNSTLRTIGEGSYIYSRDQAEVVLTQYGLQEIVDLRREDFLWEEVVDLNKERLPM